MLGDRWRDRRFAALNLALGILVPTRAPRAQVLDNFQARERALI